MGTNNLASLKIDEYKPLPSGQRLKGNVSYKNQSDIDWLRKSVVIYIRMCCADSKITKI
jgi:hypothetical protein